MSDFDEKLNKVLSDPQAMAQIAALAQSLQGGGEASPPEQDTPGELSGAAEETWQQLLPLLRRLDRPESSETGAFLHALKPFLREERRGKVDRALQLAKLVHLAKTYLGSQEAGRV